MSLTRLSHHCIVLATFAALALASCKRRDETPPAQQGYAYPQQYPQQPAYPQPAGAVALAPAFGFFCQSDGDVHCAYGHCIGGRCGGCSDVTQCKQGSQCAASPLGGTCWPDMRGGGNVPPPQPPPQPGPTPTQPPPFPVPPPVPPRSGDAFAAARQSCVDRINQYRARVRAPAVARDPSSEPCDDEESRLDARSNRPHGSFGKCGERAQNACPNYPGASVEDILTKCLQQMFDEGPGGGHYDNMTSTKYSRASCGFEQLSGGRIWTVQNFFK